MDPGLKVILLGWLPMAIFIIGLLVALWYSEKIVQENRNKKGVPIEWK